MRSVANDQFSIADRSYAILRWHAYSEIKILALHGWLDNAASFLPIAQCLPDYDIVALDFSGHGHSDHRPKGQNLHYLDYLIDVQHCLKHLGWSQCVLLGHSMGAGIASIFAAAFSQQVRGLVCLDGLGPVSEAEQHLPQRLRQSVTRIVSSQSKPKKTYPDFQTAVAARLAANEISEAAARILVQRNLKSTDEGFCWRCDPRLRWPSMYYLSETQIAALLAEIYCPTLLVRPRDSAFKQEQVLKSRAALVKALSWCEVDGGHHAHMDDAQPVAALIKNFLMTINE